ncbi:MAG TPA: hypothetical protein VKM72_28550 [Thermoanaerobaculia bacterium]|nr:hypothetical protein [Thermoanaerobaculia bacterium]
MSQRKREQKTPRKTLRPAFRDGWIAVGLTLLSWLHRLAFLRSNRDWDWAYTFFYEGDSEVFYNYARAILGGTPYDNGIPFHPPGFAYVLAFVHGLLGASGPADKVPYFAEKAVVALIGSASIGLLYLLARPYVGRTVALLAAFLGIYSFGLYVLHVAPVTEGTYQTLFLLCLLFWTRRFEHPLSAPLDRSSLQNAPRRAGPAGALLLGLLLGALALIRVEGALVGLILGSVGLWGWLRASREAGAPRSWNLAGLRPWALVLIGWVLAVAPWTVRNAVRLSETNERLALAEPLPTFVPLTIYGPINLALANNPQADGTFSRAFLSSSSHSGVLDLKDPQHLRFILHGDEMARDWALENPGAALQLLGRKWGHFFEAWRLGWTQWDVPGGLHGFRRPVDVFVPHSTLAVWINLLLAVLGLALCLGTAGGPRRWGALVLLMTCVGLVSTGLFFGYVRQGLLYLPLWLTFPAAALTAIARRFTHRGEGWRLVPPDETDPSPRFLKILGGLAVALLLLEGWGATTNRNFKATGTTIEGSQLLNRDEMMVLEVLPGD